MKKKDKKKTPIGGIEPPAAVWETAMLATTPYRMVMTDYAFRLNLNPFGLALFVVMRSRAWIYKPLLNPL